MGKKRNAKPKAEESANPLANIFGAGIKENLTRQRQFQPIMAMINSLPADAQWTQKERDRWLNALYGAVDYCVEVVEEK